MRANATHANQRQSAEINIFLVREIDLREIVNFLKGNGHFFGKGYHSLGKCYLFWGVHYQFWLTSANYVKSTNTSWQGTDPPPFLAMPGF